jgi:type IV secretory pathway VirB2 component (pilin)
MKNLIETLFYLLAEKAHSATSNIRDQRPSSLLNGITKSIKVEIAAPLAIVCIVIVGLYFMLGKGDAMDKLGNVLMGLFFISCSAYIGNMFF